MKKIVITIGIMTLRKNSKRILTTLKFDVKLAKNFRQKTHLVADGHLIKPPNSVTYSTVVA